MGAKLAIPKKKDKKRFDNQEVVETRIPVKNEQDQAERSRASTSASVDEPVNEYGDKMKKTFRNMESDNQGLRLEQEENQGNKVILGEGFALPKKDEKKAAADEEAEKMLPVENEKVQEKQVIIGERFAFPEKENDGIVEEKLASNVKPQILRAVVLSTDKNQKNGINTHCLWILEKRTEERFFSTKYKLEPGHFFEGIFLLNESNQKWDCTEYRGQIVKPKKIGGGVDKGNIWFSAIINGFQPAGGNRKFAQATAKYFGDIIEGELEATKLTSDCNGKRVRIRRRNVLGEPVWMVVEILS
ncbi:unnamed protein product [Caenorhabditis nigoni]